MPIFLSFFMIFLMAGTTYARLDFRRFVSSTLRNVDLPGKIFGTPSILHAPKKNDNKNSDLLETRNRQTGPNISVFYKKEGGLIITEGSGTFMVDSDGNKYLDCINNVACVGHSHPAVVKAGCDALGSIQTNSRFLHPTQQRYLSKLLATFPPELDTVYLVNSGSEANDLALRIAQHGNTANKKNDIICLDHAYHGHTMALLGISPYKWYQAVDGVNRQPETTHVVSCPDGYRGRHRRGDLSSSITNANDVEDELSRLYASDVEAVIAKTGGVGTFIAESIISCGGQIIPPRRYLQRCYEAVRKAGGICIADEVQTGFGRPGTSFWAFQHHGIDPDIVTIAKPMGNGYPIAAVVCRRALADAFASTGIEYFNTYGGNSVGCAIAEAVLDTIKAERLQENSLDVGQHLLSKLTALSKKYGVIGDVRGFGLFIGIELIQPTQLGSDERLLPHTKLTQFLVDFLMNERVLVSKDGPDNNVIKIKPPLVFSRDNADTLVMAMDRALEAAGATGEYF